MRLLLGLNGCRFKEARLTRQFREVRGDRGSAPTITNLCPDLEAFYEKRDSALPLPLGQQHRRM